MWFQGYGRHWMSLVSMPDSEISSLGRWKPVICSSPPSLGLKVSSARTHGKTELKASPWRNIELAFLGGRV